MFDETSRSHTDDDSTRHIHRGHRPPEDVYKRQTSPLSVEGPRVQMIFVFLIKYLQRSRYNALYLDAAAQAGLSLIHI